MEKMKVLIGARVHTVRLGRQIDIGLMGGTNRDHKFANLHIEAPFKVQAEDGLRTVDPYEADTLGLLIPFLYATVTDVTVDGSEALTLSFNNGMKVMVASIKKTEAWNMSGDDMETVSGSS